MSNKSLIIISLIILVAVGWLIFKSNTAGDLVNPLLQGSDKTTPTPSETPAPPNAPKTFQFDSSTDLKKELEKVNPWVLDTDFE